MKVTLLNTDDSTGGAAIACKRLLSALSSDSSVDVMMIVQSAKYSDPKVIGLDNSYTKKKLSWFRFILERLYFLPYEKNKRIRFLFNPGIFGRNISKINDIAKSDVIHLHWVNFGFLSIKSINQLAETSKPIVWTLHDMWAFTGGCHHSGTCENYIHQCGNCSEFIKNPVPNDLSNKIWNKKKEKYSTRNITVVCCSNWLAERAKKSSIFKNHTVLSIPNPINTAVFSPIEKNKALDSLNLSNNKKYILIVAMRIDALKKGFSYFQEAMSLLNERNYKNVEIITIGQSVDSMEEVLPFKVHAFGKIDSVEKIVTIYSAASVFVIPSLEENLPNTIMESLACGTPVVGFNIGGIPEMIDHKKNGYLADYKSVADMTNGIEWVLNNNGTNELSINSREKVMQNYDEKIVAKKYIELYSKLMHTKS